MTPITVRMHLFISLRINLATRLNDITSCDGFDLIIINVIVVAIRFNNNRDLNELVIIDKLRVADRF